MPHDYSIKSKQYITEGRKVSRQAVRREINGLLDYVERSFSRLGHSFHAGDISLVEFELQMRELLKSAHIIAASVGKGGRARMLARDWGRVGAKIKWQYGYLQKFARKIARGGISDTALASRARSYASSIFVSFSNTFQDAQTEFVEGGKNPVLARLVQNSQEGCEECTADAAEGWMSVDDRGEIGTRICGDFCKCDIEFSEDELAGLDIKVKVIVNE